MPLPSINKSCYIYIYITGKRALPRACAHGMASDCVCMCFCVCVSDCVCQSRARAEILYILHYVVWGGRPLSLLLSNVYYRVLRGSLFSVCVSVCASVVCVRADYMSACAHAHMRMCVTTPV